MHHLRGDKILESTILNGFTALSLFWTLPVTVYEAKGYF